MANRAVMAEIDQAGLSHLAENVLDHKTGSLKPKRSSVSVAESEPVQAPTVFVEEPLLVDVASHPILREDSPAPAPTPVTAPAPVPEKKRGGRPRKNQLPDVTVVAQSESV